MAVNNVTGAFVAVVLLLLVLTKRPTLALIVPVSLIVFWDFGALGVALLWAGVLLLMQRRESREAARHRPDDLVRPARR
jgi:hypothetical protein